jgi:hypothetical protein
MAQQYSCECGVYIVRAAVQSPDDPLSRTIDAQNNLKGQFNKHKCTQEDADVSRSVEARQWLRKTSLCTAGIARPLGLLHFDLQETQGTEGVKHRLPFGFMTGTF